MSDDSKTGGKELTMPLEIQVPELTMKNNLTVNDILSVAIGKVEDALRTKLRDSEKSVKTFEKGIKDTKKELDDASKELMVSCGLSQELTEATAPLKKLFPRSSFKQLTSPEIELDREQSIVVFTYEIGNYRGGDTSASREEAFNSTITGLFETLDQERDNLALEQAEQLSIRSKLSNIPALERRYKGMIAEQQLQKSKQGKELLKTLTVNIDDEMARL